MSTMREIAKCEWFHGGFIVMMVLAATASLWLCWHNPNIGADALGYLVPVQNLMAGKGYTMGGVVNIYSSPGYGLAIWLVEFVTRDLEYAAMAVTGLSYLALVFMAGWLGERFGGRPGSWLAGLFVAMSPMAMTHSYLSLADPLFAAMLMACVCHFITSDTVSWNVRRSLIQGGLLGLSCLVRPDTVIVLPFVMAWIGVRCWIQCHHSAPREGGVARVILLPFLVMAVFQLVMCPYMVFLYGQTGSWTVSNKIGFALMGGGQENPHLTLEMARAATGYLFVNLYETLGRCAENLLLLAHKTVVQNYGHLVAVGLLWLVYPLLGRQPLLRLLQWPQLVRLLGTGLIFLTPLVPSLLITSYDRYVLPYFMIALVLLAAVAMVLIVGIFGEGRRKQTVGVIVTLMLMLLAPLVPRPAVIQVVPTPLSALQASSAHLGLRKAGLRLASESGVERGFVILSRKGSVPLFYAAGKRESLGTPLALPATPEEIPEVLAKQHVDYVILDGHYVPQMSAYTALWADPKGAATALGLEWVDGQAGAYQLFRPHITAQTISESLP
ncbi:MAG: hypothetical protein BWK76_13275 [Desulfobulbaceae bacterium A2]|nr:MAG: hypothetical protein BWK76_13275 [Desulfobulbaceae bacterium A2]